MAGRPLAIVTGASTGIGYELAKKAAQEGFDLIVAANEAEIETAANDFRSTGATVETANVDLATEDGVQQLWHMVAGRPVAALFANAGRGLGNGFLDQDLKEAQYVVDTNITGTISLLHKVGNAMRGAGEGRILITGSVAGYIPGSFQAVYNGSKAFLDNFAFALRNELQDTGVTVTLLMPGPTDTPFFDRADMLDTPVGQDDSKEDPAVTASNGFKAMMDGDSHVVSGAMNKVQMAVAGMVPQTVLAERHRKMAEPGTE